MGLLQHRLLAQRRVGDHSPAVTIACHDETAGGVLAEQRETGGVQAIADCQYATSVVAVCRISERGLGAEADVGKVNLTVSATSRVRSQRSVDGRVDDERSAAAILRK